MTVNPTEPPAILLFDEDCGFCRWSLAKLLAWDRRRALRPLSIQSEEGRRLLAGTSEEERMGSWHLISDGRRYSAGAAFAPLLRLLPGGAPPARLAETAPGATERAYRFVADHRSTFGRLIPAAAKRRADRRISRRTDARAGGPEARAPAG